MAARIGVDSLSGIALGIMNGGIGVIFWIWLSCLITLPNTLVESTLAVKYREKDEDFIKWMKAHRFEMISYEAFANGKIKLDDNAEAKNAYEERKSLTNAIKNYALARLKVIKDPFAEFTDNELKKAYEDELEKYNTIQVEKIDAEKRESRGRRGERRRKGRNRKRPSMIVFSLKKDFLKFFFVRK